MLNPKFDSSHKLLRRIIQDLDSSNFVKVIKNIKCEKFGPLGELLSENIRKEWIQAIITHREYNVFPHSTSIHRTNLQDLSYAFAAAKSFCHNELPFGIASTRNPHSCGTNSSDLNYFSFRKPEEAKQFFYRLQLQRKRWWRKFSTDPGKFSFGELEKNDSSARESAKILVNFPWGSHEVETVEYFGSEPYDKISSEKRNHFTILDGKKRILPHVVKSTCNLNTATLTYIFDAFTVMKDDKSMYKFHRKLAPYKFAFAAPALDSQLSKELLQMSTLVCLELRKVGLSCLLPATTVFGKKSLEFQLDNHDLLGIPFTIVMSPGTLDTGILGVYSRDTTLQEQVHIGKMRDHGLLLMKN